MYVLVMVLYLTVDSSACPVPTVFGFICAKLLLP